MSGEVISMKDWETAKFVDWATTFLVPIVMEMNKADQEYVLKRLGHGFLDSHGQEPGND